MKEEVKNKWVAALRGGAYKQAEMKLMRPAFADERQNRFCCLGVLCDISGLGEWVGDQYTIGEVQAYEVLPNAVMNWAGMNNPAGKLPDMLPLKGSSQQSENLLSGLNDGGYNFNEIADLIEKHWETL